MRPRVGGREVRREDDKLVGDKAETAAKTVKKPNATFGMWADRADVNDPAAYVRALRQTRASSGQSTD